jgi:hypothetical protein
MYEQHFAHCDSLQWQLASSYGIFYYNIITVIIIIIILYYYASLE